MLSMVLYSMGSLALTHRRIGVATVAVAASDSSVPIVDAEFGSLIAADRTTAIDGCLLRCVVAASTARAAAFDIPAPT